MPRRSQPATRERSVVSSRSTSDAVSPAERRGSPTAPSGAPGPAPRAAARRPPARIAAGRRRAAVRRLVGREARAAPRADHSSAQRPVPAANSARLARASGLQACCRRPLAAAGSTTAGSGRRDLGGSPPGAYAAGMGMGIEQAAAQGFARAPEPYELGRPDVPCRGGHAPAARETRADAPRAHGARPCRRHGEAHSASSRSSEPRVVAVKPVDAMRKRLSQRGRFRK